MNKFVKKGLALLLAIVMIVGFVPNLGIYADAASYTYNWGVRGEESTGLSEAAEAFYETAGVSYESLSQLSGAEDLDMVSASPLYQKLQELMKTYHKNIHIYDAAKEYFAYTDCENGGGKISAFYTGTAVGPAWDGGTTWNREHTWPQSKGLNGRDEDDIMMLRPETQSANSSRGNKAYGTETTNDFFYPNEKNANLDVRGDVARIALYQYVRWGNTAYMWGASGVIESKEVLLDWMEADPVDTWEMGRNDAVQSITGTRNVFVDYPELAFDLFEEVSVPVTITLHANGQVVNTINTTSGSTITLPASVENVPENYSFVGWTDGVVAPATQKPTIYTGSYKAESGKTFYAVYSYEVEEEVEGGGNTVTGWNLITSADELTTGQYVMILTNGYAPTKYDSSGWLFVDKPTVSGTQVTDTKNAVWTLTVDGSKVTLKDSAGTFIKPKSGNNNGIQTGTYSWNAVWSSDGTVQFKGTGSDTTTLAANSGSQYKMRAYKNSTVSGNATGYPSYFKLYKETTTSAGGTVVNTYYTTHTCEHTNTENVTEVVAGCENAGCTAGLKCLDCGAILSGCVWVAPTGHTFDTGVVTPPTATSEGYTTYTCQNGCGYSYEADKVPALGETYTVTFQVPEGVAPIEAVNATTVELPVAGVPSSTYTFVGWVTEEVDKATEAGEFYAAGENYPVSADVTLYALYSYAVTEGAAGEETRSYTIANYPAGTQYAKNEEHVLDEKVTIVTDDAHFTTQLRLYSSSSNNGYAIIKTAGVSGMVLNAGHKVDTLNVYGSNDEGATWTLIKGVSITSTSYKDYTVDFGENTYAWIKLDVAGTQQVRVAKITLDLKSAPTSTTYYTTNGCTHENAEDVEAEAPDCENPGFTAGVYCPDCGNYISGHEEVEATGHKYEATVTPPTATEQGYTTHTCANCGDSYEDTFVPAVGETYTVTFWAPDYAYAPDPMDGNLTGITLPAMVAPAGYSFLGWTDARIEDETAAPEYYKAGEKFSVTEETTLYALYSYTVGGTTGTGVYELATSETQLAAGKNIVIASAVADEGKYYAISTTANTNNRKVIAVTVDGNTLEVVDGVAIIELGNGTAAGSYSLNSKELGGYLYAPTATTASSGNYLKVKSALDLTGSWNITITDGVASIVCADATKKGVMQFNPNNGAPLISCYAGATQKALAIYVEATGGETFYTTEYAVAQIGEETYSKLTAALETEENVTLLCDAYVDGDVDVFGTATLDLAGFCLNSTGYVSAAPEAYLIDSVGGSEIVALDVFLTHTAADGKLAVKDGNKVVFETVSVKQKLTANGEKTKISFYIDKLAADTKLDDAILAGEDVQVKITVYSDSLTGGYHSFVYSQELVNQYTADWDSKVFTCNIKGLEELGEYTIVAEIVSCGVTVQAYDVM